MMCVCVCVLQLVLRLHRTTIGHSVKGEGDRQQSRRWWCVEMEGDGGRRGLNDPSQEPGRAIRASCAKQPVAHPATLDLVHWAAYSDVELGK
jgi:hypothetical protein